MADFEHALHLGRQPHHQLRLQCAGNLTKTTLPDSSYLSYAYDNAHRLTAVTNALSESQRHHLQLRRRRDADAVEEHPAAPPSASTRATFDALGRMLTDVGGESQTTTLHLRQQRQRPDHHRPQRQYHATALDALNRLTTYEGRRN